MPFTTDEFFAVFVQYNMDIWPLQIGTYVLGLIVVALLFWRNRASGILVSTILGFFWLVNGAGYHWSHFSEINPTAYAFGAVFVLQAALLGISPLFFGGIEFSAEKDARTVTGLLLVAFAMAVYPVWGWIAGHSYPAAPVFGVAPCPTNIFTIGILLLASWRKARWLLIIPALWGAIGGSTAVLLNVPQDLGLLAALFVICVFAIGHWRGKAFAGHTIEWPASAGSK